MFFAAITPGVTSGINPLSQCTVLQMRRLVKPPWPLLDEPVIQDVISSYIRYFFGEKTIEEKIDMRTEISNLSIVVNSLNCFDS